MYIHQHIICMLRETLDDIGKLIKVKSYQKKTPISRGLLLVLPNQVFPCSHCLSKTTPSHLFKVFHIFHFRGKGKRNVSKMSHVPVASQRIYGNKNKYLFLLLSIGKSFHHYGQRNLCQIGNYCINFCVGIEHCHFAIHCKSIRSYASRSVL